MSEKQVAENINFISKQGAGKFLGYGTYIFLGLMGLIIGWMVFKDEILSVIVLTNNVERHDELIEDAHNDIKELQEWKESEYLEIVEITDNLGDLKQDFDRSIQTIEQNKQDHIDQKYRATVRIGKHTARDLKIKELREDLEKLEDKVEELESAVIVMELTSE